MRVLTKAGCSSAPKLLADAMFTQSEEMCDPGGYAVFIVMEALPGVSLRPDEYWEFDREKRDRIREAFRVALTYAIFIFPHPILSTPSSVLFPRFDYIFLFLMRSR